MITDEELKASRERMAAITAAWENCPGHFWDRSPNGGLQCTGCNLGAFCGHEAERLNEYLKDRVPSLEWPKRKENPTCDCEAQYQRRYKEEAERRAAEQEPALGWIADGPPAAPIPERK